MINRQQEIEQKKDRDKIIIELEEKQFAENSQTHLINQDDRRTTNILLIVCISIFSTVIVIFISFFG